MDFNAQVQNISSEQLDALFDGTPSVKDLALGEQKEANAEEKDAPVKQNDPNGVPNIDMETFGIEPKEEEKKEEKKEDPKEEKKEEVKEEKPKEVTEEEKAQTSGILKSTVNYLIEKGIWKDFDKRDEIEFTDELYADLSATQAEARVTELFEELVDSTGDYGKAIISHIKNGGNPDEIIDLFKEQKQIQAFDVSSESGQKSLIERYYTDVVGWNKAKIDEFITFKQTKEDGLESEAKEVQEKFDGLYSKQLKQLQEDEKQKEKQLIKQQEEYKTALSKEIDTFENFTEKDRKLVKNSLLKFDKKLKDGTKVNDFYVKFYEIQNNPKDYVELVHFVMDKEGYNKKVNAKKGTEAVEKSWNFVKGNSSITKKLSDTPSPNDQTKNSKIDFSALFKK